MKQATLDDIFEGKETEETPEPVIEEPAVEEETEEAQPETVEAAEVEDETEDEVEAEVVTAEPTAAKEDRTVPLAGLLDERDKRKQAEERLRQLEAEREKEKPDFWENPEQALQSMRDELAQEFDQKFTNGLLAYSMQSASYRHPDYDAMKDAFTEAVQENPALAQQAVQSADPGEYIYNTGKQFAQLNAVGGDLSALEKRIRDEVKAEYTAREKAKADKLKSVPDPLTKETSASLPREKVEGGIEPLESIFKFNSG